MPVRRLRPRPHRPLPRAAAAAAQNGHERSKPSSADRPSTGYKLLRTPSHESFAFSRAARRALDPRVRRRIAELNAADARLYEEGAALLRAKMAEQRDARRLESFINFDVLLAAQEAPAEGQARAGAGKEGTGREGSGKGDRDRQRRSSSSAAGAQLEANPEVHDEL